MFVAFSGIFIPRVRKYFVSRNIQTREESKLTWSSPLASFASSGSLSLVSEELAISASHSLTNPASLSLSIDVTISYASSTLLKDSVSKRMVPIARMWHIGFSIRSIRPRIQYMAPARGGPLRNIGVKSLVLVWGLWANASCWTALKKSRPSDRCEGLDTCWKALM